MQRRHHRRVLGAILALFGGFVAVHVVTLLAVPQTLDSDGQLVRAANTWMWLRTGDPAMLTQVGQPSWGQAGLGWVAEHAPYPPGFPLAWLPAFAVGGSDVGVLRGWSVAWTVAGLAAVVALAWRAGGPWAGLAAAGLGLGAPVVNGLARAATVDGVVLALGGWAAWAGAGGLRGRGSGVLLGVLAAAALSVKWTAAVVMAPAWAALGLAAWRGGPGSRRVGWGLLGLGAVLGVAALGGVVGWWDLGAGFPSRWLGAALLGMVGLVGGLGLWRVAVDDFGRRLAVAGALVLGPGLGWYLAHGPILRGYLDGHNARATPAPWITFPGYALEFLGLAGWLGPLWIGLGLGLAGRTATPALVRGGAALSALSVVGLAASGSPEIFLNGSIASRQLYALLPGVGLGAAAAVATLGARGPWLAGMLALAGAWSTLSGRVAPCAATRLGAGYYRSCGPILLPPRWGPVPEDPQAHRFPAALLPAADRLRVTAVLVRGAQRVPPDERAYLVALFDRNRAVTLVDAPSEAPDPWILQNLGRFDDVIALGRPPGADTARAIGADTPIPLSLGPGFGSGTLLVGAGRAAADPGSNHP